MVKLENTYYWAFQFIFELENYDGDLDIDNPDITDYWILTPENIEKILMYEDKIYASQEWKDRYVAKTNMHNNATCGSCIDFAGLEPTR